MPRSKLRKDLLTLAFGLFASALIPLNAWATAIFVMSVSGNQAQLMLNGASVRTLRVGETSPEGVRLIGIRGAAAVLESGGRTMTLGIGQSTVAESQIRADARGSFFVNSSINGMAVPAVIDTGAVRVVVNGQTAQHLGIDYRRGRQITAYTANGAVAAFEVTFARVQVGEVALANVAGMVIEGGREKLPVALIGMSFLKHVEMRRSGNTMTLSRPNY